MNHNVYEGDTVTERQRGKKVRRRGVWVRRREKGGKTERHVDV